MSTVDVIAFFGLSLNAGAIIWGAAKLSAAVDHLKETVAEIKEIAMGVQNTVHNLIARVWILEDRLGIEYRKEDNIDQTRS